MQTLLLGSYFSCKAYFILNKMKSYADKRFFIGTTTPEEYNETEYEFEKRTYLNAKALLRFSRKR